HAPGRSPLARRGAGPAATGLGHRRHAPVRRPAGPLQRRRHRPPAGRDQRRRRGHPDQDTQQDTHHRRIGARMTPAARSREQAAATGTLTHRQIMVILSGLMLGMFLAALDQTIVATAMRVVADKLNGQTAQAWVTTAYLVTSTITVPLYGKLSDQF